MKVYIVYPRAAHTAYKVAAEIFAELAERTANCECELIPDSADIPADKCHLVYIGSDGANNKVANLYLERKIDDFGFAYNTDAYRIFTKEIDGVPSLFLAGARPRAAIYAVYRYFEKYLGCRWFWDGDRIKEGVLIFDGVDLLESPRFEYRGLRYFAHRSLHRFQAEHWNFEDWKREIDWILKKRLNMFMLRIGLDDIFQKAFPEIVPYPDPSEPYPEAGINHHDRTPFWSLEYRGELRKKLLAYAFERDLIHPEDCGTVTHWYSRTPKVFLDKVKPRLLCGPKYNGELTGQTWDVLDDENLNNYFRLTDTHIKEYGRGDIFHTIGLAERSFSADPEVNMRLKLYVYRRISAYLKEKYPGAPLFIASWDIWAHKPEEARRLFAELDPNQAILLDYTSDSMTENNFTNWDVMGKFPWVFGIFSGYEPDNEIRGFYRLISSRLELAKRDSFCRGMILWPELSHGDTLATEYFALNAWESKNFGIEEVVDKYCLDRYSPEMAEKMRNIWRDFMPIVEMRSWNPTNSIDMNFSQSTFVWLEERAKFEDGEYNYYGRSPEDAMANQKAAVSVLLALAELAFEDEMQRRDIFDIARTVISRYLDCGIRLAELCYLAERGANGENLCTEGLRCDVGAGAKGEADSTVVGSIATEASAANDAKAAEDSKDVLAKSVAKASAESSMSASRGLMVCLSELLMLHEDFSLYETLRGLRETAKVTEGFERTLKENAAGYYCRSFISENASELYLPELDIIFCEVRKSLEDGAPIDRENIKARIAENTSRFKNTPLSQMQSKPERSLGDILRSAAEIIDSLNFSI